MATSSRRNPSTRLRALSGRPTSAGLSNSRRARKKAASPLDVGEHRCFYCGRTDRPPYTKRIIDDVVRLHHPEKLAPLILLAAAAFIVQHGFNALRILLNNTFEQKVIFDFRSDLYDHIQKLPLRWFDYRATGDIMTRVLEDVKSRKK